MKTTEQKKLLPHLQRVIDAIHEVLLGGLTTASDGTLKTFGVTFQEASRLQLLRLGSTLRNTHQEISRYVSDDVAFSQTRLVFFLNRSWLLCKGIQHAIKNGDQQQLEQLLWTPRATRTGKRQVVCLGVVKKVAADNFCAFEFRLRDVATGEPFTWSTVFPLKKGNKIPAEGFLHLPQKQKFQPAVFVQGNIVEIHDSMIAEALNGSRRIQFTDDSKILPGDPFDDWQKFLAWDVSQAIERIEAHSISPFDVDVELQQEVAFMDYQTGPVERLADPPRKVWPLLFEGSCFELSAPDSEEGKATATHLTAEFKRKDPRLLYGVMHYSNAKLVVQPLSIYDPGERKLDYISLSKDSIDKKALLGAMKFT